MHSDYDAIVVGSGPNGLAAAITLKKAGLSVLLIEGKDEVGGGMRTKPLTLPGFLHDVCSAVHPMAAISPFLQSLRLEDYGLHYVYPQVAAAHPFTDGTAAVLTHSLSETAEGLGSDKANYLKWMTPIVDDLPDLIPDLLSPFPRLKKLPKLAGFGLKALKPATYTQKLFNTKEAKGLWAGMAAHAIQPLDNLMTSAIGIMLMASAHLAGWPIPKGGSISIAKAMLSLFQALGGEFVPNFMVSSLDQLPTAKAVLYDVTPKQLLAIMGDQLSTSYRYRLKQYRYGMGVFKIDWALSEPVPFTAPICRKAGTIHIGNTFANIAASEKSTAQGHYPDTPFVLFAQPSIFDPSRAPEGKHTAWAYCHVSNGSSQDLTDTIEKQVERFAPGFKEVILARHTLNAQEMESYNPNYVGGDINGGVQDIFQHFSRPVLRVSPYRTSLRGHYLCSSSTPPGGGVHGMCGYHAAKRALADIFDIRF